MLYENESFQLNPEKMPKHVAIIMDGNGRWADIEPLRQLALRKRFICHAYHHKHHMLRAVKA